MRELFTIVSILTLSLIAEAQPRNSPTKEEIAEVKACFQPWLDGLDAIIRRLGDAPMAKDAEKAREILQNAAIFTPIVVNGQRAGRTVVSPPDPSKLWISVLPVCEGNLPKEWVTETLVGPGVIASYNAANNAITLRTDISVPGLIRGLMLLHEMQHYRQEKFLPSGGEQNPAFRFLREVDAYEFEFAVLDNLHLPQYEDLIKTEQERITSDLASHGRVDPNPDDPRLLNVFAASQMSHQTRAIAASLILIRAWFNYLEQRYPDRDEATRRKMDLMINLGYS